MKTLIAIIPARYASKRFMGKPLANIRGKTMIQRVYEQVKKAVDIVVIATDDKRIFKKVTSFNGMVIMTSNAHTNGTERCYEALQIMEEKTHQKFDYVINVQGDEPFIQPQQIEKLINLITRNKSFRIATLVKRIDNLKKLKDPDVVKVVKTNQGKALYFSRAVIPFNSQVEDESFIKTRNFYKHIGMYAFRTETLKEIVNLPKSYLEKVESLEQLRWLEHDYPVYVEETDIDSFGIDTPNDLAAINSK